MKNHHDLPPTALVSLRLSFFLAGLVPVISLAIKYGIIPTIMYIDLLIWLPTLLLGSVFVARGYIHGPWPINAMIMLMVTGLFWVDPSERGRGMLTTAWVMCAYGVAHLITNEDIWARATQSFTYGVLVSGMVALAAWIFSGFTEFGSLRNESGTIISNRNSFAWLLGATALLYFARYMKVRKTSSISLVTTIVVIGLISLVILSASRSIFLATLVGGFALVWGSPVFRVNVWRLFLAIYLAIWSLLALYLIPNPLIGRFSQNDVSSLNGRTSIWEGMFNAIQSSPSIMLHGFGTGGAQKALANAVPDHPAVKTGVDGVQRVSAHNTYVEWIMSYGFLGILFGVIFVAWLIMTLHRLRGSDRSGAYGGMLLYIATSAMAAVVYLHPGSIAVMSLFLSDILIGLRRYSHEVPKVSYEGLAIVTPRSFRASL